MESVSARWRGGYLTEIDVRGVHSLKADEGPHHPGGNDEGPSPGELLLSSVASCMCMAVAHIARKQHIPLNSLLVEASGEANVAAFRFASIQVNVKADLPQDQLDPLVGVAKRYCWASNTLLAGCPVSTTAQSVVQAEENA